MSVDSKELIKAGVPEDLVPIPEQERKGKPIDNFWVWFGANMAVTNWAIGALPIILGLSLMDAIWVILIGNIIGGLIFAGVVTMGPKTGVNQMVMSRSPFGIRGAKVPALMQFIFCMGWLGVNSYFAITALSKILSMIGLPVTTASQFIVALLVFVGQIAIGIYGFYVIKVADKYMMPIMAILALIVSFAAVKGGINWDHTGTVSGMGRVAAIAIAMGAIGIGWPISWASWGSDYSRYVSSKEPGKRTYWSAFAGMVIPTAWLAILGACISSTLGTGAKPVEMVVKVLPSFAIPALLVIFMGTISVNVLNVNSGALAGLALGLKLPRPKLGIIIGVISFCVALVSLFATDIATVLDQWLLTLLVVLGPWVSITLVDFYVIRKQKINLAELYKQPTESAYGDINWNGIGVWVVSIVLGYLCASTPLFTGPIAKVFGGGDYSLIVAMVVGAIGYYIFETRSLNIKASKDSKSNR